MGRDKNVKQAPGLERGQHGGSLVTRILGFIREQRLGPGERLPAERVLSLRLGVGRNALREALATLISLRVVESRANSGIYVRSIAAESSIETLVLLSDSGSLPTPTEVMETMEVRLPLERRGIELACARRTKDDLAAMRRLLEETDRVLAGGGNIADQDHAFHLALADASHNSVLTRLLNAFYRLTLPRRRAYFTDTDRGKLSAQDHRRITEAIAKRDSGLGVALIERHLGNARIYWREMLGPSKRART